MKRNSPGTLLASIAATLVLACMLSPLANAAEGTAAPATPPPVITPAGSILQVLVGLIIILLLLAGVVWMLRRMGTLHQHGPGAMRVLGAVAVGQRERVVLIEVAQTWLVVGVAPGSVNPLHSMPRSTETPAHSPAPPPDSAFGSWLQRLIEGGKRAS